MIKTDKIRNVPMIGWNNLNKKKCQIFSQIKGKVFWPSSFYCDPKDKQIISSTSNYLDFNYCSSISKKFICYSIPPEKSGEVGLKVYNNFVNTIKIYQYEKKNSLLQ